jgi:8-oxo-dGTP diphosphatase
MGMWNGVGGRLEHDEDALAGVLREVREETEIALPAAHFAGLVTWSLDGGITGGMHAFVASLAASFAYETPRPTEEGILDWKDRAWVLDPKNRGVVPNIARFLPPMLAGAAPSIHHFVFREGLIVDYRVSPMAP